LRTFLGQLSCNRLASLLLNYNCLLFERYINMVISANVVKL